MAVKRKSLSDFLASSSSWKNANIEKPALNINLTRYALRLTIFRDTLRRNPPGNWVILIFSGQKPCIRIIQTILHSFLHFSRANGCNKSSVVTPKKISQGSPRKWMSNFTRIVTQEKFWKFHVKDVILWNLTFIFSGYHKTFSLVLLQMIYDIFSPWKM